MRVFVTGADGFIGRALTPVLQVHGHHVTGLARDAGSANRLQATGVEPLVGDLNDAATLTSAAQNADEFSFGAPFPG